MCARVCVCAHIVCVCVRACEGSTTVAKSRHYTPTEILFEINEITRFLKSEIKKIGMETSKTL